MKILHIVYGVTGGAGIAAYRLHKALNEIPGIESKILQKMDTTAQNSNDIYTLYESTNLTYRVRRRLGLTPERKNTKLIPTYPQHHEYEIATFPTSSYRIERHPLVQEADIIHLHWVSNFLNYPTFFKNIKKPVIWTLHDRNPFSGIFHTQTDFINNKDFIEVDTKIRKQKESYIANARNLSFIFPSMWLMKGSEENSVFSLFPKYCIPNSVEIPPLICKEDLKQNLKIDNDKKTLLFIAHSIEIPRRGFHLMLEAIDRLREELVDFNLISIGGNKIPINKLGINHLHIKTTDNRDLLTKLYSIADIQILPSIEDNLPNVMVESFACGTPVISFANGGMAEHIKTGENGILINEINVEFLKNAIEDFLNDKYIFDRKLIRQYAIDNFSPELITHKHIDLYQSILEK